MQEQAEKKMCSSIQSRHALLSNAEDVFTRWRFAAYVIKRN
jgi:hypothetical protein